MSIYLSSQKIIKEWIDYNNHMNVSYYLLIFDKYGADTLNNIFKMGEHSAKTTGKSTMIVESNITYNQELKVDDEVDVNLVYFDHDKKRLQYKMEMIHKEKKFLASTIEVLALYVDLNSRKVSEFEDEKVKIMDEFIDKNKVDFKIENLMFKDNKIKIISNYDANIHSDNKTIKKNLQNQMANRVNWTQSIKKLEDIGENKIIEIGPNKILSGLIKRIANNFDIISINNISDI